MGEKNVLRFATLRIVPSRALTLTLTEPWSSDWGLFVRSACLNHDVNRAIDLIQGEVVLVDE